MAEFIAELLVVIEADSLSDASVVGDRAQRELLRQPLSKKGETAKVINVIVADVRNADD